MYLDSLSHYIFRMKMATKSILKSNSFRLHISPFLCVDGPLILDNSIHVWNLYWSDRFCLKEAKYDISDLIL